MTHRAPVAPSVDLTDPGAWLAGVPHRAFDAERASAPVAWHTVGTARHGLAAGSGCWSVTGYQEVRTALQQPSLFSSHAGGIRMEDPSPAGLYGDQQTIVGMDPPEHLRYRLAVNRNFLPRVIEGLQGRVEAIAAGAVGRLADAIEAAGSADLVSHLSAEVPLVVIAELLGVEPADREQFRRWTDIVVTQDDPDIVSSRAEVMAAIRDFMAYGADVLASRRREPRDDLMTAIAHAEVNGEPMDDAHQAAMWFIFLIGGNETTRNALSGAVIGLHDFSGELASLQRGTVSWERMADEVLRWWSPVNYLRRTLTADAELGGETLHAGDKVVLWLTAANHDPAVFRGPHRFSAGRANASDHVALGHGNHFCLGAHLARLELAVTLRLLYERLPRLRVCGRPQRARANFINSIVSLPVAAR